MSCINEDDFDLMWKVFPDCNKCNPNLRVVTYYKKKESKPFISKNEFLLDRKKSSTVLKQKTMSDYQ